MNPLLHISDWPENSHAQVFFTVVSKNMNEYQPLHNSLIIINKLFCMWPRPWKGVAAIKNLHFFMISFNQEHKNKFASYHKQENLY